MWSKRTKMTTAVCDRRMIIARDLSGGARAITMR